MSYDPGISDGARDEREREREWIERQRVGWWTPGRDVEMFFGPVPFWAVIAFAVAVLAVSLAIAASPRPARDANTALTKVIEARVPGLDGSDAPTDTYGGLVDAYRRTVPSSLGVWRAAPVAGARWTWDVYWEPPAAGAAPSPLFRVSGWRGSVSQDTAGRALTEQMVRVVRGGAAAQRYRDAVGG